MNKADDVAEGAGEATAKKEEEKWQLSFGGNEWVVITVKSINMTKEYSFNCENVVDDGKSDNIDDNGYIDDDDNGHPSAAYLPICLVQNLEMSL